jgi:hypothetical protein
MFQQARPCESRSIEASARARLYGWLNVVEKVPISPICCVTTARALSNVAGSKLRTPPVATTSGWTARLSATKIAWILAASARRATSA